MPTYLIVLLAITFGWACFWLGWVACALFAPDDDCDPPMPESKYPTRN